MIDHMRPKRKAKKATEGASADKIAIVATLTAEDERRLRHEFENLIERMEAPGSAAAYDAIARMTSQEVRDFFQTAEHFGEKQAPADGPAIHLDPLRQLCISDASPTRLPDMDGYLRDVRNVLHTAWALCGDFAQTLAWFTSAPIQDFDAKTAAQLVAEGRSESVLKYLQTLSAGTTG